MSSNKGSQQKQKLKDTCDQCSASKVKCSKDKPLCARCDKLGYPCFYSPARRMGRPHPPRNGEASKKAESSKSQSSTRHGSIDARSVASSHDTSDFLGSIDEFQGTDYEFEGSNTLDYRGSEMPQYGQMNSVQADPAYFSQPPQIEKASAFPTNDDLSRSNSNGTITSDDGSMLFSQCSNYGSSNSSTMDSADMFANLDLSKSPEYDCATTAMNILQQLNMTSIKPSAEIDPPSLDAVANTASMAIKRISTILVCPCSQKTDIALLASVVCAAILDTYATILHSANGSKSRKGSPSKSTMSMVKSVAREADMMEFCPSASKQTLSGKHMKRAMKRVLEDLPKVANLVSQFKRRYSQQGNGEDFLPALAASLKAGLKSLTNEATDWVAQV